MLTYIKLHRQLNESHAAVGSASELEICFANSRHIRHAGVVLQRFISTECDTAIKVFAGSRLRVESEGPHFLHVRY